MKFRIGQTGEVEGLQQPIHPLDPMCESLVTPREEFFVHNQGAVPAIDAERFRLSVLGETSFPLRLSLRELREEFPQTTILSTLRCRGGSCGDDGGDQPYGGRDVEARRLSGSAIWGGVSLADVLIAAGLRHCAQFAFVTGADRIEVQGRRSYYSSAISIEKALRPEVLLAYEMNGEPLTPEHGAPLRLVVPGEAGARGVKWLAEIRLVTALAMPGRRNRFYNLLD